jgi:cullin 1
LRDNKQDDLSRMYRLLSRIEDGIRPMLEVLQAYVAQTGFDAIKSIPEKDRAEAKPYVETLLGTYAQFSDLVRKAFENSPPFVAALDKACR